VGGYAHPTFPRSARSNHDPYELFPIFPQKAHTFRRLPGLLPGFGGECVLGMVVSGFDVRAFFLQVIRGLGGQ
jgi:hypothetical protein